MVNKITSPITPLGEIDKINEVIDQVNTNTTDITGKQATLVSGTNIKTINNTSLLGSGNIDIQGGVTTEYVRHIGEIVTSTIPLTDSGLHLLDGALISGSGIYSDFVAYISGLVSNYPDLFISESDWQTSITTYGVCGKFVYDSVNNTVRLPKITGIIEGTTDVTALGDLVEAGLPNIIGYTSWQANGIYKGSFGNASANNTNNGALYVSGSGKYGGVGASGDDNTTGGTQINIDASRSSSIYGNSTTVQPQTIKVLYYIVVATTTKTEIEVDIDEIATDLNGKADTDGANMVSSVKKFDSNWVLPSDTITVFDIASLAKNAYQSFNIASMGILPSDNYDYEVMFMIYGATGTTSGNTANIYLATDKDYDGSTVTYRYVGDRAKAQASSSQSLAGMCNLIVGSGRTIYVTNSGTAAASVTGKICGYRRIGTNS